MDVEKVWFFLFMLWIEIKLMVLDKGKILSNVLNGVICGL